MNLNQVTLPAIDIARSVDFYTRLGFTQIVDSAHYARFECPEGDSTFSLHKKETIPGPTGVTVYFECEDLDARCEELQRRGFEFLELPTDQGWLWREARIEDPSGNVICLYRAGKNRRYPPWRIEAG